MAIPILEITMQVIWKVLHWKTITTQKRYNDRSGNISDIFIIHENSDHTFKYDYSILESEIDLKPS